MENGAQGGARVNQYQCQTSPSFKMPALECPLWVKSGPSEGGAISHKRGLGEGALRETQTLLFVRKAATQG